ncbi:hypothetical protein F4780DRAFT_790653 [Xylariomycetidae sp. FL0641]|nr:hypothetical protein F4780DRAFT_790653 [Xylariomycetidae sp. FL0641]
MSHHQNQDQDQDQNQNQDRQPATGGLVKQLNPDKSQPDLCIEEVRMLHRLSPNNLDLAAAELAPLFGFGAASQFDVQARRRAQSLFASRVLDDPFGEFATAYLGGDWSLPVGDWAKTLALASQHQDDAEDKSPITADGGDVHHHYARFLVRARANVWAEATQMLGWLREADRLARDDAYWVLFHALVFLQLRMMEANRHRAPLGDRAAHYLEKLRGLLPPRSL